VESDAVELIARLAEQSLVIVVDSDDESRYRLLEPVRQYARDASRKPGRSSRPCAATATSTWA
jgi:predicted ATPase